MKTKASFQLNITKGRCTGNLLFVLKVRNTATVTSVNDEGISCHTVTCHIKIAENMVNEMEGRHKY
jgi:hypothetical protein